MKTQWLLPPIALAAGCLRIVDLDDDENEPDAIVVPFDASDAMSIPPGDALVDCAIPLPCPAPTTDKVTLCGRIYDTESDDVVEASNPTRQACTGTTASGPCSLRVRYFDALDFAMNPTGAQPIVPPESVVDDCGRFRAQNMTRATFGWIGIAVDDAPTVTPAEPHRLTSVSFANAEAVGNTQMRAYTTRVATDQRWTTTAGLTGMTFAQRGVLLKVFLYHDQPVAGVRILRNGSMIPADDFYFSDVGPTRSTIDPAQSATGANGSVLMINGPTPIELSGTGAEPAGCQWPANLGASVAGVISVDRREAETSSGSACP
jgi:hypothetical protein